MGLIRRKFSKLFSRFSRRKYRLPPSEQSSATSNDVSESPSSSVRMGSTQSEMKTGEASSSSNSTNSPSINCPVQCKILENFFSELTLKNICDKPPNLLRFTLQNAGNKLRLLVFTEGRYTAESVTRSILAFIKTDRTSLFECFAEFMPIHANFRGMSISEDISKLERTLVTRNKTLLLTALDILLEAQSVDKALVREVLTALFRMSGCVDREVFLFEQSEDRGPTKLKLSTIAKMTKILRYVAGWKIPELLNSPYRNFCYVDYPFRNLNRFQPNSNIMCESLSRFHDPELALLLWRHGADACTLHVWPVSIALDMRYTWMKGPVKKEQIEEEIKFLQYFCRAKRQFQVISIRPSLSKFGFPGLCNTPAEQLTDILVFPEQALELDIIPEDRYLVPASLQHQSRMTIRESLLQAQALPQGIYKLPIPKPLMSYLDLLQD
jgi:hypothetical protein